MKKNILLARLKANWRGQKTNFHMILYITFKNHLNIFSQVTNGWALTQKENDNTSNSLFLLMTYWLKDNYIRGKRKKISEFLHLFIPNFLYLHFILFRVIWWYKAKGLSFKNSKVSAANPILITNFVITKFYSKNRNAQISEIL